VGVGQIRLAYIAHLHPAAATLPLRGEGSKWHRTTPTPGAMLRLPFAPMLRRMDMTAIASSLISMSAQKTQMTANFAVLKKQFEMQKSVIDLLQPLAQTPAAPGTGLVVDKTA
jgi:hypothetical protein